MVDGLCFVDPESVLRVTSSATVRSLAVCAARDDTHFYFLL